LAQNEKVNHSQVIDLLEYLVAGAGFEPTTLVVSISSYTDHNPDAITSG